MEEIKHTVPFFYKDDKVHFIASTCECGGPVRQQLSCFECERCGQKYMPTLKKGTPGIIHSSVKRES